MRSGLIIIGQLIAAVSGIFLMFLSFAFMKAGLEGNWIDLGLFNLLFLSGTFLGFVGAIGPLMKDFFERGLGKVWLEQIEVSKEKPE
jgi:hypothetical protein